MDHFLGDKADPIFRDVLIELYTQDTINIITSQYELAMAAGAYRLSIDGFKDAEGYNSFKIALVHGMKLQVGGLLPPERQLN